MDETFFFTILVYVSLRCSNFFYRKNDSIRENHVNNGRHGVSHIVEKRFLKTIFKDNFQTGLKKCLATSLLHFLLFILAF